MGKQGGSIGPLTATGQGALGLPGTSINPRRGQNRKEQGSWMVQVMCHGGMGQRAMCHVSPVATLGICVTDVLALCDTQLDFCCRAFADNGLLQ